MESEAAARKKADRNAYNRTLRRLQLAHPDEYRTLLEEELAGHPPGDDKVRNAAGFRAKTRLAHLHGAEYHAIVDEERALVGLPPLTSIRRDGPAGGRTPNATPPAPPWMPAFITCYGRGAGRLWTDLGPDGQGALEQLLTSAGLIDPD